MIDLVSVTQALLVAEHLSFSRAAQVLGVRQSAVSRRVRALEDKLGVSLFERDSTGVRLTEAGRRFLERTRPALSEIDHAMKAAASAGRGAEGVIRIGILASVSGGFLRNLPKRPGMVRNIRHFFQRGEVTVQIRSTKSVWIEDVIAMIEGSASSELYALLKRQDEKAVTERAYENPVFVEDLVRNVALRLNADARVSWYKVEAENFESIHNHNAYACIEKG